MTTPAPAATIKALYAHLSTLPPGTVQDTAWLTAALGRCWDQFRGGDDTSMSTFKVHRIENPTWAPPTLTFWIERHGGTVHGSTRADLHQWTVNFETRTATITKRSYRQLRKTAERMYVLPEVDEVLAAIQAGTPDPRYKVLADGTVRINIGEIVPDSGYQQTVAGRRRRFRKSFEDKARLLGWKQLSWHTYDRSGAKDTRPG